MDVPMVRRPLPSPAAIRYPEEWHPEQAIVLTRGLRTLLHAFPDVLDYHGIAALTGPPGTGKTTAACVAATMSGVPWGRVQVRRSMTLRELLREVLDKGMDRPAPEGWTPVRLQDEMDRKLRSGQRVLVIDDAHLLTFELVEFLRTTWIIEGNLCSLVLVGHQLDRILESNEALGSRLEARIVFPPQTADQIVATVKAMHPYFAGAPDELILAIHRDWTGRRLRMWGKLLRKALPAARRNGEEFLTEERFRKVRAVLPGAGRRAE